MTDGLGTLDVVCSTRPPVKETSHHLTQAAPGADLDDLAARQGGAGHARTRNRMSFSSGSRASSQCSRTWGAKILPSSRVRSMIWPSIETYTPPSATARDQAMRRGDGGLGQAARVMQPVRPDGHALSDRRGRG